MSRRVMEVPQRCNWERKEAVVGLVLDRTNMVEHIETRDGEVVRINHCGHWCESTRTFGLSVNEPSGKVKSRKLKLSKIARVIWNPERGVADAERSEPTPATSAADTMPVTAGVAVHASGTET